MGERRAVYLVTGGCGFIGAHLCRSLVKDGHSVRVLDDLSTGSASVLPQGVELIRGDVADPATVRDAMAGCDGVFHLAAIASVERCSREWAAAHRTNQGGTVAILECARAIGGVPVVWASTAAVYGGATTLPIVEETPARPLSAYGADKLGGEVHGAIAADLFGVPNTALRFFNVYGPGQNPDSPYSGVISIFARRIAAGEPVTVFGDGGQSRDFVYVGDVVRAQRGAMERLERRIRIEKPASFNAINVCTGRGTTLVQLIESLGRVVGVKPRVQFAEARAGDIRHSLGSAKRMQTLLGVHAKTKLDAGLAALTHAAQAEPLRKSA